MTYLNLCYFTKREIYIIYISGTELGREAEEVCLPTMFPDRYLQVSVFLHMWLSSIWLLLGTPKVFDVALVSGERGHPLFLLMT